MFVHFEPSQRIISYENACTTLRVGDMPGGIRVGQRFRGDVLTLGQNFKSDVPTLGQNFKSDVSTLGHEIFGDVPPSSRGGDGTRCN